MREDGHPAPRRGDHAVTQIRFSSHRSSPHRDGGDAAAPDCVEMVSGAGPFAGADLRSALNFGCYPPPVSLGRSFINFNGGHCPPRLSEEI
jgi:hypothetical protein